MAGLGCLLLIKRVGHTLHAWHVIFDAADQPMSSLAKRGGEGGGAGGGGWGQDLTWCTYRCQKPGHQRVAHLTHASWSQGWQLSK